MTDEYSYRRNLPHWRSLEATYFVTWRLASGQPGLLPQDRDLVMDALEKFDSERYELLAYVVMDDHVHVIVRPLPPHRLEHIVHSWKSFTAHRIRREGHRRRQVWQDEYFDRIVRDERELSRRLGTSGQIRGSAGRTWRATGGSGRWTTDDHLASDH